MNIEGLVKKWVKDRVRTDFEPFLKDVPAEMRAQADEFGDLGYILGKADRRLEDKLEELESDMWFEDYLDRSIPEQEDIDEDDLRGTVQDELSEELVRKGLIGKRVKVSSMQPLRSRRDYGEEEEMSEQKIAKELVKVAASLIKASKEVFDSAAEMPRGLQHMAGKYLGEGAIQVQMTPDGITWMSDDEDTAIMAYKGRTLGVFKYGGAGLTGIKGMKDSVLLDYLNETIDL